MQFLSKRLQYKAIEMTWEPTVLQARALIWGGGGSGRTTGRKSAGTSGAAAISGSTSGGTHLKVESVKKEPSILPI